MNNNDAPILRSQASEALVAQLGTRNEAQVPQWTNSAHLAAVSLPLTRLPGIHPQLVAVCGSGAVIGDYGDPADCYDCAVAALPTDCTLYDYCQVYECGGGGDTGKGYDFYDWYDRGGDPCW